MSFLKQNSGAKIYISTLPYTQEFQICHIEGESIGVREGVGGGECGDEVCDPCVTSLQVGSSRWTRPCP